VSPLSPYSTTSPFSFPKSPASDVRSVWSQSTSAPATRRPELTETISFEEDFTHRKTIDLLKAGQGNNSKRRPELVATCVSGSGEIHAIVAEKEFWVFKFTGSQHTSLKRRCTGKLEAGGLFKYGLDGDHSNVQRSIVSGQCQSFGCAAISDRILAIGSSASGTACMMLFSIGDEEQSPGKFIFKVEHTDCVVRKLFFNPEGTEIGVLFAIPALKKEILQVFPVVRFWATTPNPRPSIPDPSNVPPSCSLQLDMSHCEETEVFSYTTRDARFSANGRHIATCSKHEKGSALVHLVTKDGDNVWQSRGSHRLVIDLDVRDEERLGFTGVSL
jgi:hypothetical protein